ncbi:YjdF family protein [Streptococcus gordonii]|uniref:YjdF family protein n=1 Tax=Streptococcus gordonii TaxID=1302 RepID=UPI00228502CA|nr:YjdF family protein [Streptococcus gordonii]MCY7135264.1 YjdF family protein [Streptococcus gordonii]
MDKISMTLTVYFEEGFWHGLFEREHAQFYRVCRVTFGAEPSMQELLDFLNRYYHRLQFSPSIRVMREKTKSISPKRLQRQAKKEQMASRSSKSQEALKLQFEEQNKIARVKRKQQKELAKQRKFELKQQKRLEKHKGH